MEEYKYYFFISIIKEFTERNDIILLYMYNVYYKLIITMKWNIKKSFEKKKTNETTKHNHRKISNKNK